MLTDVVVIDDRIRRRDELKERAARAATGYAGLGIGQGTRVAALLRNDFPMVEAGEAARLVGAYSVPLNWHNKPPELAYVLADSTPSLLVGHADLLNAARSVIPDALPVLVVPEEGKTAEECEQTRLALQNIPNARLWDDFVAESEPWAEEPAVSVGAIVYTSGTSGNPKGVVKYPATGDLLKTFVETQDMLWGMKAGNRPMVLGPLYHASPYDHSRAAFARADILVLQSRFDPERTLAAIEKYQVTHVVLVPTMFVRLLKLPQEIRDRYDLSSLKSASHTGGPCPVDIKRQMIDWWGPIITEVYGGTETGATLACTSDEWLQHPGTIGRALPGARVEIVGEHGESLAPGEIGEIYTRNLAYGEFTYLGREDDRAKISRGELVTIGDMGYLDEDGYVYLVDRLRDMVVSGGANIYPAEIEGALLAHPSVHDCAVFGIPDEEFGQSLLAVVQPVPGAAVTPEELKHYLRERISNYKIPKRIEFADDLPREESGKIFKRRLRDPYWEDSRAR